MSVVSVLLTEALSHDGFHYRVGTKARTEAAYPIGSIKGARGRALPLTDAVWVQVSVST